MHTDIEDIIALIDGRRDLINEVQALQDDALRSFLVAQFRKHERPLLDFTPHHLGGGGLSRIPVVHERIRRLGRDASDKTALGDAAMATQAHDPVKKAIDARRRGEAKAREAAAQRDADWIASRDATLPLLKHLIPKLQHAYDAASPVEIGLKLHRSWLSRANPVLTDTDYSEVLETMKPGRLSDLVEIHCGMRPVASSCGRVFEMYRMRPFNESCSTSSSSLGIRITFSISTSAILAGGEGRLPTSNRLPNWNRSQKI